jgi:hypothetical protein
MVRDMAPDTARDQRQTVLLERTAARARLNRWWIAWTALIALCIIVVALWAPFGLRRAAWGDAWAYYGALLNGVTLAPLPNSRPLIWLPWSVSYALVPTSFLGLNSLIAGFILMKGVLVYAITRQLAPHATGLAVAAALLATIYPAEVGYFFDGFLNLHQGFDTYLLAVFFLLAYWKRGSSWLLIAAIAALAFSVATYEAVLALAVGTPILLVWLERRITRRMVWTSLLWFSPIGLYMVYIVVIRVSVGLNVREAGLLASGLNVPNLPIEILSANLWNLGQRYVEAWQIALTLSPFARTSPLFSIALITGATLIPVVFLHARLSRLHTVLRPVRWPARRWIELFVLSVLWTVLGYAVFSLASVRYDGWRLGFYTVLGSSLTVALILYGATAHRRVSWLLAGCCVVLAILLVTNQSPQGWAMLALAAALGFALPRPLNFSVVLGVLLTIAMVRQLDLLQWLTRESLAVQQLMIQVAESTPGLVPDTPVILVFEPTSPDDLPFNTGGQFDNALDLIHGNPDYSAFLCPLGLERWGWSDETCSFGADGLVLQKGEQIQTIPYDTLVLLSEDADGVVRLVEQIPSEWGAPLATAYVPGTLLDPSAPVPDGLDQLFNPRPLIDR